jgi:histidinol-phosphate aminotransferase
MIEATLRLARPEILSLEPYRSARSLATAGEIFLDANESPWAPGSAAGLNRYPEPQPALLVDRLSRLYGVDPSSLFVARGTDDAIDALVRTFCRAGSDGVVLCPPTYGMYEVAANIQGASVIRYPTEAPDFAIPVQKILANWLQSMKLLFICSPNNPTGNVVPAATLSSLCEGLQGRGVVIVDEAYVEFAEVGSFLPGLGRFSNLVILRTLSKAWAMAGARCGCALGHPAVIGLLQKVRAPYPLSSPATDLVLKALSSEGQTESRARVARLIEAREVLRAQLLTLPQVLGVYPSAGNFILVKVRSAPEVLERCRARGIIVRDRSRDPGLADHVRISVGSDEENQKLIDALTETGRSHG